MKKILVLAMLASASAAQAQLWVEIPDAPAALPFTAQMTVGVGALTTISGGGDFPGDTVDAYCIYITSPTAFSASTVGGTSQDTQIWLFRPDGTGVTFNDDAGPLQSTITGAFVTAPGLYILAVSAYDTDPVNAAGAALWLDTPFGTERAPDGPGAGTPVAGWTGGPDLAPYRIALTGAEYCDVPAPGALALMGLGGLVAARRRR